MTYTTNAITDIRDDVLSYLQVQSTSVEFGSGSTTPSVSDTGLDSEIIQKTAQEKIIVGDTLFVSGFLSSLEANSENIWEVGIRNTSAEFRRRDVFGSAVEKTSAKQFWVDIETVVEVNQS